MNMSAFDCQTMCPKSKRCPSVSRDYPCSAYMALRKRRIDSNEFKKAFGVNGSESDGKVLNRKLGSDGTNE